MSRSIPGPRTSRESAPPEFVACPHCGAPADVVPWHPRSSWPRHARARLLRARCVRAHWSLVEETAGRAGAGASTLVR